MKCVYSEINIHEDETRHDCHLTNKQKCFNNHAEKYVKMPWKFHFYGEEPFRDTKKQASRKHTVYIFFSYFCSKTYIVGTR